MLSRARGRFAALLLAGLALLPAAREARGSDLRVPRKLTVALSDELLGQLSPDERRLYFLSNRNATTQIFTQDLTAPASVLLFDEEADVTLPRLAPDGKRLAYVSFRDEAIGQLCVRDLPALGRHCLAGAGGALEVRWIGANELLLVMRGSEVHGDLQLQRVSVAANGALSARPWISRNLTGAAVSPDGKWLVFVPLDRVEGNIGPAFASQASRRLVLRRLDGGDDQEVGVHIDLPGISGQPSFSPDGKWIYFTQYLNDTDQNDVVDGGDHGVIFRVPFDGSGDAGAITRAYPDQITSASWNCQYPAPSATQILMTCAKSGSLDLYTLPADGVIPPDWSPARVREELEASRDSWEKLLLLRRLERSLANDEERAALLLETIRLHLLLAEYEAALEYARALGQVAGSELASLGPILEKLITQRRALRAFDRGQAGQRVLDDTQKRLMEVEAARAGEPAATTALRHVVACELLDDLGQKPGASDALDKVEIREATPAFVVQAEAERAELLLRQADRPEQLVATLRLLVDHPSLPEGERLRIGGVYARAVVRGLPAKEAQAALARERHGAGERSVRAFRLDLEACLARIDKANLADGRACVAALYAAQPSIARRRVLVAEVVRRTEETDTDDLEYELVRRWAADVPRDSAERRHAVRLMKHVVADYGYASFNAGRYDDAAAEFDAVTKESPSLECHIGYIESRLAAGHTDLLAEYTTRYPTGSPILNFVRAYLEVRHLHELHGAEFLRAFALASADAAEAERALPQECEVHALTATLLHLAYLRRHDSGAAEQAATHYLLALDLARDSARYRSMVLEQLALLHEEIGNYRIALSYFEQRGQLPFFDPKVELGHDLTRARALLHIGREKDAAAGAGAARALADATPALSPFVPLALDRAALYALAAGDGKDAVPLYDRAEQLDAAQPAVKGAAPARNRVTRWLARATAELGAAEPQRALDDLARVDGAIVEPRVRASMEWKETAPGEAGATYDLLRHGLRAQSESALSRFEDAWRTQSHRRDLLAARAAQRGLDEDLKDLALAEGQLASLAHARNTPTSSTDAAHLASQSLVHADAYAKRAGTQLDDSQLAVLTFAIQLHLLAGVPADAFDFDLAGRTRAAFDALCASTDPARRPMRRAFGVYLTLLGLDKKP